MEFQIISRGTRQISAGQKNLVTLTIDHWNDFAFVTMFNMAVYDHSGSLHAIGMTKIGFIGQVTSDSTHKRLPSRFDALEKGYFSLGQNVDFYKNIESLPENLGIQILEALRDIVHMPEILDAITDEDVFRTSLLRDISISEIKGQFARVLSGLAALTDYKFKFSRTPIKNFNELSLDFEVTVDSRPSSNIHALIGRNGVGKTTLLNDMIEVIIGRNFEKGNFFDLSTWGTPEIPSDYFSGVVSVSFSAFDPFDPPAEQSDPALGPCYSYIGLKNPNNQGSHRTLEDLRQECIKALCNCFIHERKKSRWKRAIEKLGSDENFASMDLSRLIDVHEHIASTNDSIQADSDEFLELYADMAIGYLKRMSSGHAIVLLTITSLVATVAEKTLVLLDEPESHLHPPLLAAFIRALSELLHDRNGVAIIATHSPVVLQEVPRSCVWKINRFRDASDKSRPTIETFGENVGMLTSEVFSLEVERSGFHEVLKRATLTENSYDKILESFSGQIGLEGRVILKSLTIAKNNTSDS